MPDGSNVSYVITRRKKFVFFTITILTPILFFALLEASLRIIHYGVDLSLFKQHEVWGQEYYQMNPEVKYRYFGTSPFQPSTDPAYFKIPKPEGVYRIICLGESTSAGYPYWFNGAFPAFLLTRLKMIFPKKRIEMINLSMTATNSYTALDLLKELAKCQPDLVIYYGGHNEFYGALGVASNLSVGSYRPITELYLQLIHFRTFQLVRNLIDDAVSVFHKEDDSLYRGTEMEQVARGRLVPFESPMYKAAHSIFRRNLEDMREYCQSQNIPLIIGTQVSNLRDQPPFVSGNSTDLSVSRKADFHKHFTDGVRLQGEDKMDSASLEYEKAIMVDSLYADAHYRLAQCLDSTGKKIHALHEYTLARNFDELRFRTDSDFNNLIRSMSDDKDCYVADVVEDFKKLSPDSLIGHNLIFEHLHPNSRGAFAIAQCYAEVMREHGLLASTKAWAAADTVSDSLIWQRRLVTAIDEEMSKYSVDWLTSGWPFTHRLPSITAVSASDTMDWIAEEAVEGKISWSEAHLLAIDHFSKEGNWNEVARIYRTLLYVAPLDITLYSNLAGVYLRENLFDNAASVLLRSLRVYPTLETYRSLGDIMMRLSMSDSALIFYGRMSDFAQTPEQSLRNGMATGYAYARAGRYEAARSTLTQLMEEFPNFQPARRLLDDVNAIVKQADHTH